MGAREYRLFERIPLMKRPIACLIVFAMVFPIEGQAARSKKKKFDEVVKSTNMDQIEQAANYFLARVEADPLPKGEKILKCDPPMRKVNAWLAGPLRALSDEKRTSEIEDYKKDPGKYFGRVR